MSLQGLPDLQRPIPGPGYRLFYPYENAGSFIVLSSTIEIATTSAGRPDFLLELVRGISPAAPPAPYALLDFRVKHTFPADQALTHLRHTHRTATVAPAALRGGFMRLQWGGAETAPDGAEGLFTPVPLSAGGLGVTRFVTRISPEAAVLIERALGGQVLGLVAWIEMELDGVAPRVPVKVRFEEAALLTALARVVPNAADPVITRERVEELFERDIHSLPLHLEGSVTDEFRRDLIEALADHVRLTYGSFAPAAHALLQPSMRLDLQHPAPGATTWDLSQPTRVPRGFVATLDPFASARRLAAIDGVSGFVKHTVVPPLPLGTRRVHVAANLPGHRTGVLALGVDLSVAPTPPHRMQALQQTVELVPPADAGVATLKLSVAEPLDYWATTWVVAEDAGRIERLVHAPQRRHDETLELSSDDFPVRFISISATPALLDVATVTGRCAGDAGGRAFERRFALSREAPATAVAVPADGTLGAIEVEAGERGGAKLIRATVAAGQAAELDLTSFAEFGSHRVSVEGMIEDASSAMLAVDLVPEGEEDHADAIETLTFTAASPRKEWHYVALSPFRSGYRFRTHGLSGPPGKPWSDVQSPAVPLRLGVADHRGH